MIELIYYSTANEDTTEHDIFNILRTARVFNFKHQITGCLLFHNGDFIQILEGEKKCVCELFSKIEIDPRHSNVTLLVQESIEKRLFDHWSMAYHIINKKDIQQIEKLLFVKNFMAASELAEKPTHASKLFWYMSTLILQDPT